MTENDRQHLMCALTVAIREQRRLEQAEQVKLRIAGFPQPYDSAELCAWMELLERLEKRTL